MKTNELVKTHDKLQHRCIYYSYSTLYDLLRRRKALDMETSASRASERRSVGVKKHLLSFIMYYEITIRTCSQTACFLQV